MKHILILITVFCLPAFATLNLKSGVELRCLSTDNATIDSCELRAVMGSTDSAAVGMPCKDDYTLTAGELTDMNAILVNAVANTKTVHSIP